MKLRINVTKKDIAEGVPGDALSCPIARATQRRVREPVRATAWPALTRAEFAFIGLADVESGFRANVALPRTATDFVRDFDALRDVKPLRFIADFPEEVLP